MVVKEHLSWILDRPWSEIEEMQAKWSGDEYRKHLFAYTEERDRRKIEFTHSLGLKCDCVGWSSLDLTCPDAGEILNKIEAFCKEEGWLARGGCSRWYEDFESGWYELELPHQNEAEPHIDERFERGERRDVYAIRAYKNKNRPILNGWCRRIPLVVSARFREACIKHNIQDVSFCWIRDVGRYASEQYFFMYPKQFVSHIACNYGLEYSDRMSPYYTAERWEYKHDSSLYFPHGPGSEIHDRLTKIGGKLSRVAEIFYDMGFSLQDACPAKLMPDSGFACIHVSEPPHWFRDKVLIHKNTAELLIQEKVLSRKNLCPALLYEEVPPGYVERKMQSVLPPEEEHFVQMQSEYEAFIKIPRPLRKATPKEAVKLLRKAKTARKADFQKRMKKELNETLEGTGYALLAPYYLVADGGMLSDEYRLFSFEESKVASAEFAEDMAKEELLEARIEGLVFACCPDGDRVILRADGTVARVSHEVPEILEEWPVLSQFFAECIELEE